jgi:hypothetical protein
LRTTAVAAGSLWMCARENGWSEGSGEMILNRFSLFWFECSLADSFENVLESSDDKVPSFCSMVIHFTMM